MHTNPIRQQSVYDPTLANLASTPQPFYVQQQCQDYKTQHNIFDFNISISLSDYDQEEASQSKVNSKASYDPKKCEGKAGRKRERIHHRMVKKPEARCTFENFTKNYNEQEKEGDAYHFIPAIG